MIAAGTFHTVLLRSDGTAVACGHAGLGRDGVRPCPALDGDLTYTQVAAGECHTVLLRSDGSAVAWGDNMLAQCDLPTLYRGLTYTQVAAGNWHTVLLRSDGTAVACGSGIGRQWNIPTLAGGLTYTYVAATVCSTVLLRSDGAALVLYHSSKCDVLAPSNGRPTYVQVAAGERHVVMLRKDGTAVAWGETGIACGHDCEGVDKYNQYEFPALEGGLHYTHVAAGGHHTVLLTSDGAAVACGDNHHGQCNIPALDAGLSYTHVAAGGMHTVLLRSDGTAVACGDNSARQCNLPTLDRGLTFGLPTLVLQASFDGDYVVFKTFSGNEICQIRASVTDRLAEIGVQLATRLGRRCTGVDAVFPGGEVLSRILCEAPLTVLDMLRPRISEPPCKKTKRVGKD